MTPEGVRHEDISVKSHASPCCNIYVTFSIVVYGYSIVCNYSGITPSQVRYYAVKTLPYQSNISEAEEKTQ